MQKLHPLIQLYNKVNNFGKTLDMHFEVIAPGETRHTMMVGDAHLATPIAAHGGAVAGFMDGVLGVTALSLSCEDEKLVSTVEFKINYLAPVTAGSTLIGIGKVISAGKRILVVEGKIYHDEKLVASATGTFNAYPYEKSGLTKEALDSIAAK